MNNKHDSEPLNSIIRAGLMAALLIAGGCEVGPGGGADSSRAPALKTASAPPPARAQPARYLVGAEGAFSLDAARGRPLVVAVLGAGTHDAAETVRGLNRLYDEWQSEGLTVVGLLAAVAPGEDAVVRASDLRAVFPIAEAATPILSSLGGVRALPSLVLVDSRGAVRKQFQGAVEADELRAALRDLISDSR